MKLRKMLPVLLMVWPYLFFALMLLPETMDEMFSVILYAYMALTVVVYFGNMLFVCSNRQEGASERLAFWDMVIKLVHIPFYLLVFAVGAMFLLAMVVPALVLFSPMVVMTLAVIDWLLMLTSSSYGIQSIRRAKKQGILTWKSAMWHTVLHLCFVTDVISAVCIYRKIRKSNIST